MSDKNHPKKPLILMTIRAITPVNTSLLVFNRNSPFRISYVKNRTTILVATKPICQPRILSSGRLGKIKATRTIGKHYRIPVSEALSLLRTFSKKKKSSSPDTKESRQQQVSTTNGDEECGNCLTGNENNKQVDAKKKNLLHAFGYGVGRSVHILKGRKNK